MSRITVAITGASGSIYAVRLLRALDTIPELSGIDLVVSAAARTTFGEELDAPTSGELDLAALLGLVPTKIRQHPVGAIESRISSGSNPSLGMVVIPCSVGTLARIAHGLSDSLLTRAADVCLKERRRLLLVVRETPLSTIHLQNMLLAAQAGATVMPAMPAFYGRPATLDEMVDQFLARVIDHFGLPHQLGRRWRPRADQ